MQESDYQAGLIKRIKRRFPGCDVLKNDSGYRQGIPDLSIFFPDGRWAWLEVKLTATSRHEPNQDYYIRWANDAFFGAFIFPENEKEVLDDLEQTFGFGRPARFLKC